MLETLKRFAAETQAGVLLVDHFRKAGDQAQEYLKVSLSDVMVSSVSLQDHAGGALAPESISLAYAKIKMEYKPQKADGTLGAAVPFGWNIAEHKAEQ